MKLGLVTYNIGRNWDIETIIEKLEAAGFEAVELRTTHKHGVEPSLDRGTCSCSRALSEEQGSLAESGDDVRVSFRGRLGSP